MDAIEILGKILGHKTSQPGRGTDVLKDIFRRGTEPSTSSPSSSGSSRGPVDMNREARELEALLNVARDRGSNRSPAPSPSIQSRPSTPPRQNNPFPRQQEAQPSRGTDYSADYGTTRQSENECAVVLIRAMVNASKSDGRIDENEQNQIIEKLGDTSRESIDFLRHEFNQPLDVQAFVDSVPIGMEQQVYAMSLIAIDLDERSEASYLQQLAQELRIPLEIRRQIHERLGVPNTR